MKTRFPAFAAALLFASSAAVADDAELALRIGLPEIARERAEERVAALPPGPGRDAAFLVAAAATERVAGPEETVAWLDSLEDPPVLAGWFRGRALARLGRPDSAADVLSECLGKLGEDDPLRESVRADLANALSLSGRDAAAVALSGGSEAGEGPAAVYSLAMEMLGNRTAEAEGVPDSLLALARATAAAIRTEDLSPAPPDDEALALAAAAVSGASDPEVLSGCRCVLLGILSRRGEGGPSLELARAIVASGVGPARGAAALRDAAAALLSSGDHAAALALADLHASSYSDPAAEAGVQRIRALAFEALSRLPEASAAAEAAVEAAVAAGDAAAASEARLESARLALALGRPRDAAAAVASAREAGVPPELEVRAARLEAECLAAESSPEAPEAFERVAGAAGEGTPEALDALVRAAQTTPDDEPEALAARTSAAEAALDAAKKPDPAPAAGGALDAPLQARAALAVALRFMAAGDVSNALDRLEIAASIPGGGDDTERAKALCPAAYQAMGRLGEALGAYAVFTNEYPASRYLPDVRFWRASRAFDEGDWPLAADLLLSFADGSPDSAKVPHALYLASVALSRSGRAEEAIDAVKRLAAAAPDSPVLPEARFVQADALASLMRFDAAALEFSRVASAKGVPAELALRASMRRADCLFAIGGDMPSRRAESLEIYRQILADPGCAGSGLESECHWKIGRSLERDGNADAALREYFACIEPFEREPVPGDAAWYSRAVFSAAAAKARAGRRDEAAALLGRLASSADLPGREEAARRIEALSAAE